ncbi:MAG: DUF885 domain-containing protein [Kangiellaceae bacterium]
MKNILAFLSTIAISYTLMLTLQACGSSSSDSDDGSSDVVLANVADYQMLDTQVVLDDVTNRLNGLSIQDFFAESYQAIQERNLEGAVSEGLANSFPLGTFELNNISDEFYTQSKAIEALILEKLLTYDRSTLSEPEQLSYDVYKAHLEFQAEWAQYKDFEYPATYGFFGWPGATEQFFTSIIPVTNKIEADTYLLMLNQIGRRFDQIIELLDARKAAGVIEPSITLQFSRDNVQAVANTAANQTSYYTTFQTKLDEISSISTADKQTLTALLLATVEQRVLPAYSQLATKMSSLLTEAPANIGFGQFEGGLEFYDFSLRYFTSSDQTSDQIHELGLIELARIHAEMRVLFDELGYPQNESLAQLFARADADGGTIKGEDAVAFYEDIIAEAYTQLPAVFETIPEQEVVVIGGQSGGYYISGSDDGTRPGAFYASTVNDLAYTRMPTLAYHEAVPGHHMQIALARELNLPEFRKRINFTSFVEGWGLYAERLAKDLGWYEGDIYGDLGRLQFEAMRAARLVIDTGIHNKGWTYNESDQFHIDNVGFAGSIARYSVWPGQATAYMTGMLKFLELRQRAEDQLGENYDIKSFHSELIGSGSMPTNLLDGLIDRFIERNLPVKNK